MKDKTKIENPSDELFRKMIDEESTVKNLSKYYNDEGDPDSENALKYCVE